MGRRGGAGRAAQPWAPSAVHSHLTSVLLLTTAIQLVSAINLVVNKDNLKSHFSHFNQSRNHQNPASKEAARQYIRDFVAGLENRTAGPITSFEQQFNTKVDTDENEITVLGVNLIFVIPGAKNGTPEDRPVLVGAHYDTLPNTPGVDDNGSGMTALLETLRLVLEAGPQPGGAPRQHTMLFVAFDMQEYGQVGSQVFIEDYLIPEILMASDIDAAHFQGAFILETIMNFNEEENSQEIPLPDYFPLIFKDFHTKITESNLRGDFLMVGSRRDEDMLVQHFLNIWGNTSSKGSDSRFKAYNLLVPLSGRLSKSFGFVRDVLERTFTGDNINFWEYSGNMNFTEVGLKALFLSDTAKYRGVMKQCFHKACDDSTMLTDSNLEFLTLTTRVMAQVMLDRTAGKPLKFNLKGDESKEVEDTDTDNNIDNNSDKGSNTGSSGGGNSAGKDTSDGSGKAKKSGSDRSQLLSLGVFVVLCSLDVILQQWMTS